MRTRAPIALRHLALATGLVVIVVWLYEIGSDDLSDAPTSLDALAVWIDRHNAVTLAFALVRVEALVLAGYLLVLTAASAVVRLLELPRATRLVDRFTLPFARGVFGGAAALGVMVVPGAVHRPAQTATTSTIVTASVEDPDAQATLHLEVPDPEAVAPVPVSAPVPGPNDTWVVQAGDSLWSIASAHLADLNGTPPADAQVVVMWNRLIDLNRDRLVNPAEPDLIFADQVFELPAVEIG
jgi:nucleoid-associated protein YgaU